MTMNGAVPRMLLFTKSTPRQGFVIEMWGNNSPAESEHVYSWCIGAGFPRDNDGEWT